MLRGEDADDGHVDLFVEVPPGATLYDLARVEIDLEGLLGCKVEIVTSGSLAGPFSDRVKAELAPL